MLIVRGVNLYPSQVEHALLGAGGVAPHYRLIVERPGPLDELTLECEPAVPGGDPGAAAHAARAAPARSDRPADHRRPVPPGSVPRSEGKAVRVVDRRPAAG